MEGSKTLFCSSKIPWARERASSKFVGDLGARPQKVSPAVSSTTGVQPFYGKRPVPLLWAGSRTLRRQITARGVPNRLNYCLIFI